MLPYNYDVPTKTSSQTENTLFAVVATVCDSTRSLLSGTHQFHEPLVVQNLLVLGDVEAGAFLVPRLCVQ